MRWYKTSSMTVSVGDYVRPQIATTIYDLSSMIESELYKILEKLPHQQIEAWKAHRPRELFTIDGDTRMDDAEGVLNFYCNNIPQPMIGNMLKAIPYYANKFGGEVGQPYGQETIGQMIQRSQAAGEQFNPEWLARMNNAMNEIRVMRFKAKVNPNPGIDFAPEINFSNMNARFIFQDVLNYPSDFLADGFGSVDVNDLLMKLGYARTMLKQRVEEQQRERQDMSTPNMIVVPLDQQDIEFRLNELERIALWAKSHNYSTIQVG